MATPPATCSRNPTNQILYNLIFCTKAHTAVAVWAFSIDFFAGNNYDKGDGIAAQGGFFRDGN